MMDRTKARYTSGTMKKSRGPLEKTRHDSRTSITWQMASKSSWIALNRLQILGRTNISSLARDIPAPLPQKFNHFFPPRGRRRIRTYRHYLNQLGQRRPVCRLDMHIGSFLYEPRDLFVAFEGDKIHQDSEPAAVHRVDIRAVRQQLLHVLPSSIPGGNL